MRIIGVIPHPSLRISVFRNDNRLTVKFESAYYEIAFKLGDDDRFRTVEDVAALLDPPFLEAVQAQFESMHGTRLSAFTRRFSNREAEEFESIL